MTAPSISIGTTDRSVRRNGVDVAGLVFAGALLLALLFSLAILAVLIGSQMATAIPVFQERGVDFLTSDLSSNPANAGIAQGLIGTALLVMIVALTAFPIGIMTAIFLEEYSADNRFARFIDINIRNLAGVPSVVYGILGFTVFVALFANHRRRQRQDRRDRRAHARGPHPAAGDHHLGRGDQVRPQPPARGRLRPGSLALAGRPPTHPAGGGARAS